MTSNATIRVCFQLQVDPARLDEYRAHHAAVWPEMLRAIEASGRRNYSLFLRDDGLLIGYYETDDDVASQASLEANPDTASWEATMAPFFVALGGGVGGAGGTDGAAGGADGADGTGGTAGARPDQAAPRLPEVFHLEDQLSALR